MRAILPYGGLTLALCAPAVLVAASLQSPTGAAYHSGDAETAVQGLANLDAQSHLNKGC